MQEIKKRRILIASVLKPVDDVRMTEKIGRSLAEHYEVHITGYPSEKKLALEGLTVHAHAPFNRLSLKRIMIPWKVLSHIIKLRPAILMITTHELLITAMLAKCFVGCKLIYDVQENYYRNILHTQAFPPGLRSLLAAYVRIKEKITSPFIDHFLLAEKGYADEMTFLPARKTVIENKFKRPGRFDLPKKSKADGKVHLLFSGTLAESTGVFIAIALASRLHRLEPETRLTIIGYCPQKTVYDRIVSAILEKPFIQLTGGNQLVPHQDILRAIQTSDFGIIAYPPNPATDNSIPTKLYEYLGNKLPILLINHNNWAAICESYPAAIPFSADNIDEVSILQRIRTDIFYRVLPTDIFWESEEKKLLALLVTI